MHNVRNYTSYSLSYVCRCGARDFSSRNKLGQNSGVVHVRRRSGSSFRGNTTTEVNIRDYTIPKDTMVFVNLWSVHRNPAIWKDPEVFNPRRFLNDAGEVIDPKALGGFLPFSAGRRKCPGEPLALKTISVFLGALLHSFRFSQDGLPAEYQGINFQGKFGLTLQPETFYVRIEER